MTTTLHRRRSLVKALPAPLRPLVAPAKLAAAVLRETRRPGLAVAAARGTAAAARGDDDAAGVDWRSLAKAMPTDPRWPLQLAMAARTHARYDDAERIAIDAVERGARDENMDFLVEHYARWSRQSNAALPDAEALIDDPAAPGMRLMQAAIYMSSMGRLAAARAGFDRLLSERRLGDEVRVQLRVLDILEAAGRTRPVDFPGWLSPARGHAVVREAGSRTLAIAFMPPGGIYGVPINAFHAMIAPSGVNAIYLYDSKSLWHLDGTDMFGGGYDTMIAGLKEQAAAMNVDRVVTVGFSATGFTSLQVALDLRADAVLAFSPLTSLSREDMHTDGRLPGQRERMLKFVPRFTHSLLPKLMARDCCPTIEIYYDTRNVPYSQHAHRIADVPGVTLHGAKGAAKTDAMGQILLEGRHQVFASIWEVAR